MPKTLPQLNFIEPMECRVVPSIPDGPDWQYEVKLDGWRAIAIKKKGETLLYSRSGKLLNGNFPSLVKAIGSLPAKRFMLDGEIVALDEEGHHSFQLLARSGRTRARVQFHVFDLLHFQADNLMKLPLTERRTRWKELFENGPIMCAFHQCWRQTCRHCCSRSANLV